MLTENTAKQVGGKYLTSRFADIGKKRPRPEKTGQAMANDIIQGLMRL